MCKTKAQDFQQQQTLYQVDNRCFLDITSTLNWVKFTARQDPNYRFINWDSVRKTIQQLDPMDKALNQMQVCKRRVHASPVLTFMSGGDGISDDEAVNDVVYGAGIQDHTS